MCGIFGYTSDCGVSLKYAISCMKKLESRGYDSCGIAYRFDNPNDMKMVKAIGSTGALTKKIELDSSINLEMAPLNFIGHLRWSTCGKVNLKNCHPHTTINGLVTLVHNGIIENAKELKVAYSLTENALYGDTDTEIAANVIEAELLNSYLPSNIHRATHYDLCSIIEKATSKFTGTYAFAIMIKGVDGIFLIRNGSPLILGRVKSGSNYTFASHQCAFPDFIEEVACLNERHCYYISRTNNIQILDWQPMQHDKKEVDLDNGYDTLNEIKDQLNVPTFRKNDIAFIRKYLEWPGSERKVYIIGCGTSYHAALFGERQIMKTYQNLRVEAWVASEARYESELAVKFDEYSTCIFLSQSGETADTLACLRLAKSKGAFCISVVNTENSSMERESDTTINIGVGTEFAVASTKAYLAQCAFFNEICKDQLPLTKRDIELTLGDKQLKQYKYLADNFLNKAHNIYFIGKLADYIQCREGALKMKELTYVPSEAYPAGELKHGPLAMVDGYSVVIAVCTYGNLTDKIKNALDEVISRGAEVILICSEHLKNACKWPVKAKNIITVPSIEFKTEYHSDLLSVIPMQCLAYYLCKAKGQDDMKPRNLAKSVTTE